MDTDAAQSDGSTADSTTTGVIESIPSTLDAGSSIQANTASSSLSNLIIDDLQTIPTAESNTSGVIEFIPNIFDAGSSTPTNIVSSSPSNLIIYDLQTITTADQIVCLEDENLRYLLTLYEIEPPPANCERNVLVDLVVCLWQTYRWDEVIGGCALKQTN